jgi:bacillithiol synthase
METYNCLMNQNSARTQMDEIFSQEKLSFEKIPQQSQLFRDFLADSEKLQKFFHEKRTSLKNYAQKVLENYKIDRELLCDVLAQTNKALGAGNKTFENLELLRKNNCLAVVTGQQAGLFSGALYTIYKALTAIKLAENLRQQNIKAVPVFWIAEEDHDFEEVKKIFNLDKKDNLCKSENSPEKYLENTPVGLVAIDETINKTIDNLFADLPRTEFSERIKNLLAKTYYPGETYSQAFARLIIEIFADYGLIILSPLETGLKKLCAPIFVEAVKRSSEISSALLDRNAALAGENYKPQVLVEKDFFPFFFQNENDLRQALRRDAESEKIKVQKSKLKFELRELEEIARKSPEKLSPNALMRPVVQDFLLPTLVYIGGAAEIAYFAQNAVIYKQLNRPVTPIRHRASFTIVERKHARTIDKYGLKFNSLFEGKEKLTARIVEEFLDKTTAGVFAEIEEIINDQLNRLDRYLLAEEPTLSDNLANRRRKILWHIGALRKKYHRAQIQKNKIVHQRLENLFTALFPDNALQERTLNVLTFLNRYSEIFIDWVYEAVEIEDTKHQVLFFK